MKIPLNSSSATFNFSGQHRTFTAGLLSAARAWMYGSRSNHNRCTPDAETDSKYLREQCSSFHIPPFKTNPTDDSSCSDLRSEIHGPRSHSSGTRSAGAEKKKKRYAPLNAFRKPRIEDAPAPRPQMNNTLASPTDAEYTCMACSLSWPGRQWVTKNSTRPLTPTTS